MRIGTWNLAGRWSPDHQALIADLDCNVWLLTEVSEDVELPHHELHATAHAMAPRRRWAAVASRHGLAPRSDPHPASAMAEVEGLTYCSSILPWRSCGSRPPWIEGSHGDKTEHAVAGLLTALPTSRLVWGGDWNHALRGREWSGSKRGRANILDALAALQLQAPTADLPHQIEGLLTIDHIAVSGDAVVKEAERHSALLHLARLSDHDAYVVHLEGPAV